jgi:hypothetical protein
MLLRAGNITYSEINLFTIFTFRCDSRFSQSIANGHNFKRYENKYFINKGFFKSASRIKDLISLFDLAFRRFYHHLENDLADPMMMNLDIFSFFGVFSAHLKEGIDSLKNRAEAGKLQMQFIEVLSNAIEMPVSRVTLYVLQGLWGYLLMIDDQGIFSFKNKSKEQIIKSIMVFYRLIERLKRLPDSFLSQHDVPFEQLIMTYDHHKSAFEKNLSKSQNVSIIEFLTLKTTESFMNFSGPKNAAGGLGDVSFLDDSLFKEMQEDLFSQSTIAVTDLYSEVSGK